jgi:[ribosomal protein S5]-alanine N-acetyltransferase
MNSEELVTERLFLKKFTEKEFTFIFENYSEAQIRKELGIVSYEAYIKEQEKYKRGVYILPLTYFQLIDKSSFVILGWCGFHHWYSQHSRAEIGYYLLTDETKHKGIMTEAIKPILTYGFTKMNLNRIEAYVAPDNGPSLKLMKKYGFTREGYLRQHYFYNNKLEDSLLFSLLKQKYDI